MAASFSGHEFFHLVLIRPTHYDDDGYPIQWVRSALPSSSLACLNGLAEDARQRRILGPEVEIRIHTFDETNRRLDPARVIRRIRREGGRCLVALVGVQTNQFPRAVDIARRFRAADMPVCVGGFHVSGCLAMLPEMPPDIRDAQAMGISLFAGEAEEGRFDRLLQDALAGTLQPLYNLMTPLPGSEDHRRAAENGQWMDSDMNRYDLNHVVAHHPRMSDAELYETYRAAWAAYYTLDHIRTLLRRAAAHPRGRTRTLLSTIMWFRLMITFEDVHPLEGGALRLKFRRDRRHGLPLENPLVFYPRHAFQTVRNLAGYWRLWRDCRAVLPGRLEGGAGRPRSRRLPGPRHHPGRARGLRRTQPLSTRRGPVKA